MPFEVAVIHHYCIGYSKLSDGDRKVSKRVAVYITQTGCCDVYCYGINCAIGGYNEKHRKMRGTDINHLNPTRHMMHQQFNIQQLYALPTVYLCVLCLSENRQQLVPLKA
jgi:hypothetical protein